MAYRPRVVNNRPLQMVRPTPKLCAMHHKLIDRLRKSASAAAVALAALLAPACATVPPTPEVAKVAGPALWKVADKDTTIYLFGTVHALAKDTPWMRGAIGPALASADTLVTEVDLGGQDPAAMQSSLLTGETLRGILSDAQRAKFDAGMTAMGLPVTSFDRYEPWYATLLFTIVPLAKAGIVGENGVEKSLDAAGGESKRHAALETVDFQLSLFDSLPRDAQVAFLLKTIDGAQDIRPLIEKMVAEWLAGDADRLAELMNEDMAGEDALVERLLYQRNRTWADWVANRMKTLGTVFMAVGAGHLAGANSVQADLAAKGFRVERVQ
jgi:uncharacterized protein YbaP (TraB family)